VNHTYHPYRHHGLPATAADGFTVPTTTHTYPLRSSCRTCLQPPPHYLPLPAILHRCCCHTHGSVTLLTLRTLPAHTHCHYHPPATALPLRYAPAPALVWLHRTPPLHRHVLRFTADLPFTVSLPVFWFAVTIPSSGHLTPHILPAGSLHLTVTTMPAAP